MKKYTVEDFVERAKIVHGEKYDYSKVEYINSVTKVCIICPEHGEFWQTPSCHLSGQGCPKCGLLKRAKSKTKNTEWFIKKAKEVHGEKYDYSKSEYVNTKSKICIICPKHGEFLQSASMHLQGNGCPECGKIKYSNSLRKTTEKFIYEAREKWGDKYDYSKVKYETAHKKVCIICPTHGEFWQEPDNHLRWGCKCCGESHLENEIREMLSKNGIAYEEQKQFPWLKSKGFLKLDFFLPSYNIAIECQGEQHFERYRFEKDDERLKKRIARDECKKEKCLENGIHIIYYGKSPKHTTFFGQPIRNELNNVYKDILKYGDKNKRGT